MNQEPVIKLNNNNFELHLGDFREKIKLMADNSIDAIFTDIPYKDEDIHLCGPLGLQAFRLLKEGSGLFMVSPDPYLDRVMELIKDSGMKYWGIFHLIHAGNHAQLYQRMMFAQAKSILWFIKGEKTNCLYSLGNVISSEPPENNKAIHGHEQSPKEVKHILDKVTVPGQVILDPFMGSGTTGIGALQLKRKFIGIEIDELRYNGASKRLNNFVS